MFVINQNMQLRISLNIKYEQRKGASILILFFFHISLGLDYPFHLLPAGAPLPPAAAPP